jgi:hypothetical protein
MINNTLTENKDIDENVDHGEWEQLWTPEATIDEICTQLNEYDRLIPSTLHELEYKKYLKQAASLLKSHGTKELTFKIYLSDLSPRLIWELSELDEETRGDVLCKAVGKIIEHVYLRLYPNNASGNISVCFIPMVELET